MENANGHQADKIRKETINKFKSLGLKITIEANLKIVNFLDVTLNLQNGTYQPFHKPNETPMYINVNSNHPPNIIKKLPSMIERRISDLSATKEIFDSSKLYYEQALKKSGYDAKLQYVPPQENLGRRRNRKRQIIWYNPPYSKNVKTKTVC